jgi:hypothetical protein
VLEQDADPVAQQVHCRLEAGGEHQTGGGAQLGVVEVGAALAGVDQLAHQVVAGGIAEPADVGGQPGVEALEAALDAEVLRPAKSDVEAGRRQLTEFEDAGPFVVGDADDVADDGDRQLRAVPVDHVDDAVDGADRAVPQPGDQCLRGLLHPILQRGNGSGGEHR